jgi:hypothetical protein
VYGLLLQLSDRNYSSPPVNIGVPADNMRNVSPMRAARR